MKVCVLEVFDILSIQRLNGSICGDVYVVFNDSLFDSNLADSGKNSSFPYSVRRKNEDPKALRC